MRSGIFGGFSGACLHDVRFRYFCGQWYHSILGEMNVRFTHGGGCIIVSGAFQTKNREKYLFGGGGSMMN